MPVWNRKSIKIGAGQRPHPSENLNKENEGDEPEKSCPEEVSTEEDKHEQELTHPQIKRKSAQLPKNNNPPTSSSAVPARSLYRKKGTIEPESQCRLSFAINKQLHHRLKMECARQCRTIISQIEAWIEEHCHEV